MTTTEYGFVLLTLVDLCGAVLLFLGSLSYRMREFDLMARAGLVVMGVGMLSQAGRNIVFLTTGISPADTDLPLRC